MDDDSVGQTADRTDVRLLNVPKVAPAHYDRNFIRNAVCELRFPTIFEIEDQRPPSGFWRTLRKDFPIHSVLNGVQVGPASMAKANAHQFTSKRSRWTVVLKPSSITLETAQYDSFDEFEAQLRTVIAAAKHTIDSDFFTRIGLRYINTLPCRPRDVAGWVNPVLVGPLVDGVFGDVDVHFQQIRGTTDCGGYLFQHGLGVDAGPGIGKEGYVLDFDFYREEVGVEDALATVRRLHELEFSMFSWALGDRAREYLAAKKGAIK
ncbi:TIGR04255 family protein [Dyella sp.]|uniref:TIGR04255 family protein n=1 Tax=Dyella sp. TaxID=1869338 RepID=UPI002B491385|nr:TIGR04255 family protein [Dyella sp.]HKT26820.1 TIGR04255 family protein [Dyella sp.]